MQLALPMLDTQRAHHAPRWHVYVKADGTTTMGTLHQIRAWRARRRRYSH